MNMKRVWYWWLLGVLVVGVTSCTSGSVSGSSVRCSSSARNGSCEGTYATLSGTHSQEIKNLRRTDRSATVNVHVTVDAGSVRVYTVAPDGTEPSATAAPGQPATLSGQARASAKAFRVYFAAGEQPASGVRYTVEYSVP